jgi:NADH:ubiquinone oxidoreductase subunit C
MTKRGIRVRLEMKRQFFYLSLIKNCYKKFLDFIILKKNDKNSITLVVKTSNIYSLIKSLKTNSLIQVEMLNDICVVDYPENANRFEINYNLLSVKYNFRFFIKTYTSAYINSLSNLFDSAN